MRITGGETVQVWRHTKDRFGDKSSETMVGSINHVVFQFGSSSSRNTGFRGSDGFQETFGLETYIYAPRDAAVKLQARDRLKVGNRTYQVVGDRGWDSDNPATGYDFGYYMMQVESDG